MKISDYSMDMASSNRATSSLKITRFSSLSGVTTTSSLGTPTKSPANSDDVFDNSTGDEFSNTMANLKDLYDSQTQGVSAHPDIRTEFHSALARIRHNLLDYFLRHFFGEDYVNTLSSPYSGGGNIDTIGSGSMVSVYHENTFSYSESECTTFTTTGKVCTADGREIDFDASFSLSRSFECEYKEQFSQYEYLDPLVINLDNCPTELGSFDFKFDLDCDGKVESISGLSASSGFLALDKDDNGKIDDGSELFGALSGNGFKDLAKYDEDGNGWIDENDSIFDRLKVWQVMADGTEKLLNLKELGIGAMYLGSAATNYHMTDTTASQASAYLRRSGIFLYENGMAGTMQQLDMAKLA